MVQLSTPYTDPERPTPQPHRQTDGQTIASSQYDRLKINEYRLF